MNMSEPTQFIAGGLCGKLLHDVDMSRYTSWRAGGRAQHLYQPADLNDLLLFLRSLPSDEALTAVGLGSNLLVRDGGLRGTVLLLHAALNELRMTEDGMVYVQAGVPGAKLARFAALHNLSGAEFFAGIPGTVGGMLAMNAGCYGSDTWGRVARVQVATRSGELLERAPQKYEIGYRHVVRSQGSGIRDQGSGGGEMFVGAWLNFPPGDSETARRAIKALLAKRIASQPLHLPNAGSVFRNPPGNHAAKLIEQCGLKGRQIGGARVSEQHANFIVNVGKSTAADIEGLITEVQTTVRENTGILLQCEVRIVGSAA